VIASHYAEAVERKLIAAATLRSAPSADSATICELVVGERFLALDESLGWTWGYRREDHRVGYIPTAVLAEDRGL